MPVQLTLWPMSLPVLPVEATNYWLRDSNVCDMDADDLRVFIADLEHDYALCKDMPWADETLEAANHAKRILNYKFGEQYVDI